MILQQTGPQKTSPILGKKQNCAAFGSYEPPYSAKKERRMCHGGIFDGDPYQPCPVRSECKAAVDAKARKLNGHYNNVETITRGERSYGYSIPDFDAVPTTL